MKKKLTLISFLFFYEFLQAQVIKPDTSYTSSYGWVEEKFKKIKPKEITNQTQLQKWNDMLNKHNATKQEKKENRAILIVIVVLTLLGVVVYGY